MAEYHVGAGCFGIYAGTINKNKKLWVNKTECTQEALAAVRDYMISELLGSPNLKSLKRNTGAYEWTLEDGKIIELRISVKNPDEIKDNGDKKENE